MGLILVRTRIGLIYEVAKLNARLRLFRPAGQADQPPLDLLPKFLMVALLGAPRPG